jgi:hypothetical protein
MYLFTMYVTIEVLGFYTQGFNRIAVWFLLLSIAPVRDFNLRLLVVLN